MPGGALRALVVVVCVWRVEGRGGVTVSGGPAGCGLGRTPGL